jgi:ABC-2 type transport system permease protein
VVWGILLATVLPTLVLMEALLVGTAVAVGVSPTLIIALVLAAILLSMGSSAIGLFYSINNSRYNPDKPQLRISPGASMIMYLVNLVFLLFLALGISYLFPPQEIISVLKTVPAVTFEGGFWSGIVYGLYRLSRPMLWPTAARVILGIIVTAGVWSVIFFGFMALTVRQSRKGFRVELITGRKRKR